MTVTRRQTPRDIFRVTATASGARDVEAWFEEQPAELGAIARTWFSRMRACGADVREQMHDGCPVACISDAPFGYVDVFTAHVNVGFFQGASLPDPSGALQGTGRFMRHVKLRPSTAVDAAALDALIDDAYLDMKRRVDRILLGPQPGATR